MSTLTVFCYDFVFATSVAPDDKSIFTPPVLNVDAGTVSNFCFFYL